MTLEVFRSGKAKIMGNGFGGHSDCARKVNRAGLSELYTAYPSKALRALEEKNPRRRGWFEDVHFGIFISFDRANPDTVDFLTKPASLGGLLDWSCAMPERPSPPTTNRVPVTSRRWATACIAALNAYPLRRRTAVLVTRVLLYSCGSVSNRACHRLSA